MEEQTREEKLAAVRSLWNDIRHIRKVARKLAGQYLQSAAQEIADDEIGKLDDEDVEDNEYFDEVSAFFGRVAEEIEVIGREMTHREDKQ